MRLFPFTLVLARGTILDNITFLGAEGINVGLFIMETLGQHGHSQQVVPGMGLHTFGRVGVTATTRLVRVRVRRTFPGDCVESFSVAIQERLG